MISMASIIVHMYSSFWAWMNQALGVASALFMQEAQARWWNLVWLLSLTRCNFPLEDELVENADDAYSLVKFELNLVQRESIRGRK